MHTHATIDYAGGEQAKATLVDLAEEGMAVNFGKRLPPTCKVYFQFQLPGQMATVRLSGQVIWQDWNGRAGIQFVDVPQASRRILREWLKHQSERSDASASWPRSRWRWSTPSSRVHKANPRKAALRQRSEPDNEKQHQERAETGDEGPGWRSGSTTALRAGQPPRETRYACRLGAEVYQQGSSVRNYCHLSDLGPGGCYLEMPLAFAAGIAIEIIVRTHDMKLRLKPVK